MKLIRTEEITLIESSMPEGYRNGAPITKWSGGSHGKDTILYHDSVWPHLVYESLEDANISEPGTDGTKWKAIDVTDRDRKYDPYMESRSAWLEEIEDVIDVSGYNYFFMANIQAVEVELTLVDEDEMMTSPDCSSPACDMGAGWSHDPAGQKYGCDGTQTGDTLLVEGQPIKSGDIVQVTFEITNYVSGSLMPYAGGLKGDAIAGNGTYRLLVTAGDLDTLCGLVGDSDWNASVVLLSVKDVPKYELIDMDASFIDGIISYLEAPQEYKTRLRWEFPTYGNATLRFKAVWKPGNNAEIGIVRVGYAKEIGHWHEDIEIEPDDYSIRDKDPDMGYTRLVPGNYADGGSAKVWFANGPTLDLAKNLVRSMAGHEVILDLNHHSTDLMTLVAFCYIEKPRISVRGGIRSRITIKYKGLV